MALLGTLVNVGAILVGGFLGLLFRKGLPQRISDTLMKGLGLCVFLVGISGMLEGKNALIAILSIAVGALLGELLDLDRHLNRLGAFLQRKLSPRSKTGPGAPAENRFAEGFVSASLLFCVGAMAVVGALDSGLTGNHETLFAKSLIDGLTAMIFASSLGAGVLLSALPVLLYQGAITLLAGLLSPVLTATIVAEMTCVGSLLIVAIALNMLGITKLKVMNYLPAIFLPLALCQFL